MWWGVWRRPGLIWVIVFFMFAFTALAKGHWIMFIIGFSCHLLDHRGADRAHCASRGRPLARQGAVGWVECSARAPALDHPADPNGRLFALTLLG